MCCDVLRCVYVSSRVYHSVSYFSFLSPIVQLMDFLGVGVFYIPGLLLVSLTTFPNLLGPTFNTKVLSAGLLGLMPIGTGFIKSIVNVFGAKQFHPLQSRQVESYYVNFYVAINIGALIGGILVPIIAQQSMEVAI
jgi:POT family proton-dependent oligopeptide transporter